MAMVQDMQKVHCCISIDIVGLFRVDKVPGATDVYVGDIDGGIEIGKGREGDLAVSIVVCGINAFVVAFICG
jgi:hypothetical protein